MESNPEKQSGIYNLSNEDLQRQIADFGYSSEEYGVFGKHYIKRQEYDGGAALIRGKVIDTKGAQLRVRYLSPYNFIIAAKQSPYNQRSFCSDSEPYFNNIVNGKGNPEQLFQYLASLKKEDDW